MKFPQELYQAFTLSPKYFLNTCFEPRFPYPFAKFHDLLIKEIKRVRVSEEEGEISLILIFRGAGKTTISLPTLLHSAFFDGLEYLLLGSATKPNTEQLHRNFRTLFDMPTFRYYMPEIRFGKDVDGELLEVICEDLGVHFWVGSKSINEQVEGLQVTVGEKVIRPQIAFYDDLETLKLALSDVKIKKNVEWLDSSLAPALAEKGRIIVVGTTFRSLSVLQELRKRDYVHTLKIPALVIGKDAEYISKLLGIEVGKAVWEDNPRYNESAMYALKKRKSPHTFYSQYILEPDLREGLGFDIDLVKWFKMSQIDLRQMSVYIFCDISGGGKKHNDPTGLVLFAVDSAKNRFVLDAIEKRMGVSNVTRTVANWINKYKLLNAYRFSIGIENPNAYAWGRKTFLVDLEKMCKFRPNIFKLNPKSRKKGDRIKRLIRTVEDGKMYFQAPRSGADGCKSVLIPSFESFDSTAKEHSGMNALDALGYSEDEGILVYPPGKSVLLYDNYGNAITDRKPSAIEVMNAYEYPKDVGSVFCDDIF